MNGIRGKIQFAIVVFMGLTALTLVIGALILKTQSLDVPDSLIALGSAAVGGLLGYLQKDPTTMETQRITTDEIVDSSKKK